MVNLFSQDAPTWQRRALALSMLVGVLGSAYSARAGATSPFVFKAKDGTTRTAKFTSSAASLYFEQEATPWFGRYAQNEPSYQNASGAVAARNLLYWYGADPDGKTLWTTLANEMKINHAAEGVDTVGGCIGTCVAGCGAEPVCSTACSVGCTKLVGAIGGKGTRQALFVSALQAHAPPGYKLYFRSNGGRVGLLTEALKEGNPVAVLVNAANHMNTYTVVTQVARNDKGQAILSLANQGNKNATVGWEDFVQSWSLKNFGDAEELQVMEKIIGERPYFMAYYGKSSGRQLGQLCSASADCASGVCDARFDAGCVPNKNGKLGDFCTSGLQCGSTLCENANSLVPAFSYSGFSGQVGNGTCTRDDIPLGERCQTHPSCRSGRCDNRPNAGCVEPDGRGLGGEFCTTHQQCKSGVCNVTANPRGTCKATDLDLGDACQTHQMCSSKRCDNRPGAGCVAADGGAFLGNFCTTHQQCRSGFCKITSGIAGSCKTP